MMTPKSVLGLLCLMVVTVSAANVKTEKLVWDCEFSSQADLVGANAKWKHELTLGGGGNWAFSLVENNRSTSFVNTTSGILHLQPEYTADVIGEANLENGYTMDIWGADPPSMCTGNAFYGCSRTSGAGGNYLNPIRSARIRTAETFSFKYGRVEIRAKLPKGDWMWPAIWMLPAHQAYGLWPASGEIDIMESRGNDASYPNGGINQFGSTLHWGPFFPEDPYIKTHEVYNLPSGDFSQDFHVFGMIWNETNLITYLDDESNVVLNVDMSKMSFFERGGWNGTGIDNPWQWGAQNAPFDQEFYLIMNVAVGGTSGYFQDGVGGKPWTNDDSHAVNSFWGARAQWEPTWTAAKAANANSLQVDYVRVYQDA